MNIGVDLGTYQVKTSEEILFSSLIKRGESLMSGFDVINWEGEYFTVGTGCRDTTTSKASRTDATLKLLFTAIAKSTNEQAVNVVLGLPLSQYRNGHAILIDLINNNRIKTFNLNGIDRTIIIENVAIFPEAVASVDNTYNGIIVDVGGKTTDICIIKNGKLIKPYSHNQGTVNLHTGFINKINTKFSLDLDEEDAIDIIKNGLRIKGIGQNINFALEEVKDFTDNIISILNADYKVATNDVIVTGGGGKEIYDYFHSKITHAILHDDCIFANAKGYKKVADSKWR